MTVLSLCVRAQTAAFAVVRHGDVLEVQRTRLSSSRAERSRSVARKVQRLIGDYAVEELAVDERTTARELAACVRLCPVRVLAMAAVLRQLTDESVQARALRPLLSRYPKLSNLVTVLPGKYGVKLSQRRQVVSLLAAAIGLAHSWPGHPNH